MTTTSFDRISRSHREIQTKVRKQLAFIEQSAFSARSVRTTNVTTKASGGPTKTQAKQNEHYLNSLRDLNTNLNSINNLLDELKQGSFAVSKTSQNKIAGSLNDLKEAVEEKIAELHDNLGEQGTKHADPSVIQLVNKLQKDLNKKLTGRYDDTYIERLISGPMDDGEVYRVAHYIVYEQLMDDNKFEWPVYYFVITEVHYKSEAKTVKTPSEKEVQIKARSGLGIYANTFHNVKPLPGYKLGSEVTNESSALRVLMLRLKADNFKDILDPKPIPANKERIDQLLPGSVKSSSIKDDKLTVVFGPKIRTEAAARQALQDVWVALRKAIREQSPRNRDQFVSKVAKKGTSWTGTLVLQPLARGEGDVISQNNKEQIKHLLNISDKQFQVMMDALRQGE